MNELLKTAIEAHGGLQRWEKVKAIHLEASITGAIWHVKSRPDILKHVEVIAETQAERLTMTFPGENKQTIFEPRLVTIDIGGEDPALYNNPVNSFNGHTLQTPWQDVHVAYFSGEALWTYLNIPFIYAYPGFETEEIAPWQENGQTWRRLKVTFPDSIATHCREQISYFGPDGLMRRHDYAVNILGGATAAKYSSNYRNIDGIIFPTSHRVYAYQGDHDVQKDTVLVAIDFPLIALFDQSKKQDY